MDRDTMVIAEMISGFVERGMYEPVRYLCTYPT
jgi:hypothetical protein